MNFLFSSNFELNVYLDGQENRKKTDVKVEDLKSGSQYVYYDGETVSGKVNLTFKKAGTKLDHQGIKIEFVGQIELFNDKSNRHEFTSLVRELANPGELIQNSSFPFEFIQVEKPYESYQGSNAKLNYFLRVTVVKRLSDVIKEIPITVHTLAQYPESNTSIKMEVGIEDCLHIEFEYNKSKYYLSDVIVGKIYFILVRLKLKHMEIQIIKRESVGSETNALVENEVVTKFEIMDGLPVRGESIPIRLFLSGYDLTPSMKDINKKFSVRYYINLVLVDDEDRRYFKQQEITLFRKLERQKRVVAQNVVQAVTTESTTNSSINKTISNNNKNNNKGEDRNDTNEIDEEDTNNNKKKKNKNGDIKKNDSVINTKYKDGSDKDNSSDKSRIHKKPDEDKKIKNGKKNHNKTIPNHSDPLNSFGDVNNNDSVDANDEGVGKEDYVEGHNVKKGLKENNDNNNDDENNNDNKDNNNKDNNNKDNNNDDNNKKVVQKSLETFFSNSDDDL